MYCGPNDKGPFVNYVTPTWIILDLLPLLYLSGLNMMVALKVGNMKYGEQLLRPQYNKILIQPSSLHHSIPCSFYLVLVV